MYLNIRVNVFLRTSKSLETFMYGNRHSYIDAIDVWVNCITLTNTASIRRLCFLILTIHFSPHNLKCSMYHIMYFCTVLKVITKALGELKYHGL